MIYTNNDHTDIYGTALDVLAEFGCIATSIRENLIKNGFQKEITDKS